jgi:hypothetical protein
MATSLKSCILSAVTVIALLLCAIPAKAQFIRGEKTFGPRLGYISENGSMTGALVFTYAIKRNLRIAPEIGCVFRNQHKDAFTADLNFHFPVDFGTHTVALYPLAGINYSSWANHYDQPEESKDSSSRYNRFGLNGGAGFELRCNSTMKIFVEAKYCLIKSYSSTQVAGGIAYIF